ncbi:MAG: hypothetical protein AVO35_03645 [Candidatus Aegiribacteria sp. MLS_C]|nr:MAG: hypothetical protein AVO35_03645 [Candidatus Aegiribacteria sp. MLS_C]
MLSLLVLHAGCGGPAEPDSLMCSMPAGHDFYLTLNPELAGLDQVLRLIAGYADADELGRADMVSIVGFDPFDWREWVDVLALRPGDEIGLVIDGGRNDIRVVTFYLPTDDAASLEEFATGLRDRATEARAGMSLLSTGEYTAVSLFEEGSDAGPVDDYQLDGSILDDNDYSRLSGEGRREDTVLRFFADTGSFPGTEGFRAMLLECRESGGLVSVALSFSTEEDVPYLPFLASEGSSEGVTVPAGTDAAMRLSFNMPYLKQLAMEAGLDREVGTGLEEFGLSSFEELFDSFGGDLYAGALFSGDTPAGFLQLGVRDMEAVTRLLDMIFLVAAGSGDPGMTTFEFRGRNCYRTSSTGSIGMEFIEFGVVDEAIVIGAGVSLEQIAGGTTFEDYTEDNALGLEQNSGMILTADLESIASGDLVDDSFRESIGESGIKRLSSSAGYSEGVFAVAVVMEFEGESGFMELLRLLGGI